MIEDTEVPVDVLNKSSEGDVLNNNREGGTGVEFLMIFWMIKVKVILTEVHDDILNINSEGEDVKLEAYEAYDQVRCQDCSKVFNIKQYLSQHVTTKVHRLRDCTCDTCGKSFLNPRKTNKLHFSGYRLTG